MAERQGFEPWVPARAQRFSRPPRSTTPASLLGVIVSAKLQLFFVLRQDLNKKNIRLFKEHKIDGRNQTTEGCKVIPLQWFALEKHYGEYSENYQCDSLLDDF